MSSTLEFRLAQESDQRFITSGFLDSYRTARAAGITSMKNWYRRAGADWADILARPTAEVIVAYHPGEQDHRADIYGFIAVERDYKVHGSNRELPFVIYVYVKKHYRRLGVARKLFEAAGISYKEPFHYAMRTSVVSKLEKLEKIHADADWKHLVVRFPPTKTNPNGESINVQEQARPEPAPSEPASSAEDEIVSAE